MNVLIVDDNLITATVLEDTLRENNFDAVAVNDAEEALYHLRENPQVQLVMVDLMMPGMDGFQLIRKIKDNPDWETIPIVVCSALGDIETVKTIASLGCKHYVLKPPTEEELLRKIDQAMESGISPIDHQNKTMAKLGLDEVAYQKAATALAKIVHQRMESLRAQMEKPPKTGIQIELGDIAEGATLFNAKRLLRVLERFQLKGRPSRKVSRSGWKLLMKELTILQRSLQPKQSTWTYSI